MFALICHEKEMVTSDTKFGQCICKILNTSTSEEY